MNTYTISISVIKVYHIEVNADDRDQAIETAMDSSEEEIAKDGKLITSENDYAEIVEQEKNDPQKTRA